MSKKTIVIDYVMGQQVRIKELDCYGVVTSIWISVKTTRYEVRYFTSGSGKEVYFYKDELEPKVNKKKEPIVFH